MNCQESVHLINTFSTKAPILATSSDRSKSQSLEQEKSLKLPVELTLYLDEICPEKKSSIVGVGHPIELLGRDDISWLMDGFNFDVINQTTLANWQDNWFLIATEGGAPIIIDLNENNLISPVYNALRTEDGWEFAAIADSIGQFLVCALAIEHALTCPDIEDPLDEDFNLADEAAQWLFPFLINVAAGHYDEWASVFENYLDEY